MIGQKALVRQSTLRTTVRDCTARLIHFDFSFALQWTGWAYGEAPSYKGEAPPDPGHVLKPADEVVALTPKAAAKL